MHVASLRCPVRVYFLWLLPFLGWVFCPFDQLSVPDISLFPWNSHFSGPRLKPYLLILLNTSWICFLCWVVFSLFISISSKYVITISRLASKASMICWKRFGATFIPNGRRFRVYKPRCVWMVRYLEHSSSTLTCKYTPDKLILESIFPPLSLGKCLLGWEDDSYDLLNCHLGPLKNQHKLVFFYVYCG